MVGRSAFWWRGERERRGGEWGGSGRVEQGWGTPRI